MGEHTVEVEAQIREAEQARIAALLARDYDAIETLSDDRLAYIHSNGHRDTKASLLEALRGEVFGYLEMQTELQQIEVFGDVVWVYGQMRAVVQVGAQPGDERHSTITQLWVRDGGSWRLLSLHVTGRAA